MSEETNIKQHFIRQIITDDLASGKHSTVYTRFPPEPNGYLHIGHAKSICLNFGMAADFNGHCFLRFDDTNPCREEEEYVHAIIEDVKWLGFDWGERLTYASDYYQQLYDYALLLINQGDAYVDSLNIDEIREYRGSLQSPGKNSPYRSRSVEENLDLFHRMKQGEFKEGEHVLRAKIDMASGNLNMRDPVIYRIRFAHHQRTGDAWCVYPMYDYAHALSDAIEGISHSLCTLEFQDHRPLYDWCVDKLPVKSTPHQYEFARLNLSHTITSKRKLRALVEEGHVEGWDDPRLSTLRGMRARGYPAKAIRNLCDMVGISKSDSVIDLSLFEECVRDELNQTAPRAMAVLDPLKIVIENYPEDKTEMLSAAAHPNDEAMGRRSLPFTRELYIEREDFMEAPEKKFFRLAPGKEVRLRSAYVIKCEQVIKSDDGEILELRCSYDPDTLGKKPEGRKVKGVIHWVSCQDNQPIRVKLYDRLFSTADPASADDFSQCLNPQSLQCLDDCYLEAGIDSEAMNGCVFQFERLGYFKLDCSPQAESPWAAHRVVSLRDQWKIKEKRC